MLLYRLRPRYKNSLPKVLTLGRFCLAKAYRQSQTRSGHYRLGAI